MAKLLVKSSKTPFLVSGQQVNSRGNTILCPAVQRWLRMGDGPPHIGLTLHDRGDEDSRYVFLIDYVNEIASIERWAAGNGGVTRAYTAEIDTWYELESHRF